MPVSLTLENPFYPIHLTEPFLGVRVPWEVTSYAGDHREAESRGGFFDLSSWSVLRVAGPDARDFLNRMSTVDFKNFDSNAVPWGCFLTGRGLVVTLGHFLQVAEGFDYIIAPPQKATALEHIEKFHFAESLTATDVSEQYALFGLWKPSEAVSKSLGLVESSAPLKRLQGADWEAWRDDYRPSLWWVRVPWSRGTEFIQKLRALDVPLLGHRLFEYYRIRSAAPAVGREIFEKEIVLEAGLDRAVARNKGCYPGQEVVERIFTYGQVNRKLLPVAVRKSATPVSIRIPLRVVLEDGGEKAIGSVVTIAEDPDDSNLAVGLAYVHRLYWDRTDPLPTPVPECIVTIRRPD